MKIFNIQPVVVNEYIYDPSQLDKENSAHSYISGFDFSHDVSGSLKTLTISYDLKYLIGGDFEDVIIRSGNSNTFEVEIGGTVEDGDVFLSYNCSCQFNFECESRHTDELSLSDFLNDFYSHITTFLSKDKYEAVREKEKETRLDYPLSEIVIDIIHTLQ